MELLEHKVPVISYWEERDVMVATDDNLAYVAMIDPTNDGDTRYDGCGTAEVVIDTDGSVTLLPCHDTCQYYYVEEFARLKRAADGASSDYRLDARNATEAIVTAAQRAGISLAGLSYGPYSVAAIGVDSADDLDSCDRVFMASKELTGGTINAAYEDTKLHAAEVNNLTWVVGSFDIDRYRSMRSCGEVPDPFDGDDCVSGCIWQNVDFEGSSTPTEEELLGAI